MFSTSLGPGNSSWNEKERGSPFFFSFKFSSDDVIDVHQIKGYSSQRGEEGLGLSECAWGIRATVGCTQKVRPQSWASALLRHVNDQQLLWRWINQKAWSFVKKFILDFRKSSKVWTKYGPNTFFGRWDQHLLQGYVLVYYNRLCCIYIAVQFPFALWMSGRE